MSTAAHRDPERHALWELADELQRDLRTASARLTALRSHLSALELPDPQQVQCPDCGLRLSGPLTLAEHRYHSHAGPEPEHWLAIERRAVEDDLSALSTEDLIARAALDPWGTAEATELRRRREDAAG